jgi:RNA polymerase sigma-70 factor (ECF subfamily)
MLGDQADAEDATQEALLRAWRAAGTLRDPAGFQAWFDRILVNICRDHLRRRGRVRFIPLDTITEPPLEVDPFRGVLERDAALRALALLEPDERVIVVLHYFADLTLAAVAARTGWPLGTVKSRLHQALRRMAAGVEAPGAAVERGRP